MKFLPKFKSTILTSIAFSSLIFIANFSVSQEFGPSPIANESKPDNNENETVETSRSINEEHDLIDISESLPVDEVIVSLEDRYQLFANKLGLESDATSSILLSSAIIFITFFLIFLLSKIMNLIRKKILVRLKKFHVTDRNIHFYSRIIFLFLTLVIITLAFPIITLTWDSNFVDLGKDSLAVRFLVNSFTIFIIVFLGAVLVDVLNGVVETVFRRWSSAGASRIDTLLPIARNAVFLTILVIFTLMLLSELGIDVMPLLAGAGVIGFAVGFGAQTLIKDLLTGFIIILEDLIQVGDIVELSDRKGVVEKITIRKVQLRDLSGTVYTVPFSEISVVENLTKDFSYAMFHVGVAYREDIRFVMDKLKDIDNEMRDDETLKAYMLEPMEIFGLDEFSDSAVIVKARIKTEPLKKWIIFREFNLRMKVLFDKENIEIPFPHQTVYFGEAKNGSAPPLRVADLNEKVEKACTEAS